MIDTRALPGPKLPALVNALYFGFAPERFAKGNRARFGDTYALRTLHGTAVFTTNPEHVKRIFAADSDTFESFAATALTSIFGAKSVLLTSGPTHKRQRKLLTPPLSGQKLRAFGATMEALAHRRVDTLRVGETVKVHDLTTEFTLDVIVRVVFGAEDAREEAELRALLRELVAGVPPIAVFIPKLQETWFPPWKRYVDVQAAFRAWLVRTIASRRAHPRESEDVLSLLLAARYDDGSVMDDDEIHDQLVTLLLAGHETTAIALASAVHRLLHNPRVLAELLRELHASSGAAEDVVRLPYLAAVLDETLRIDPIVTDVARVPKAPFALEDGLVATKEDFVVAFIEGVHRDPSIYPNPDAFEPERFVGKKPQPNEFFPFGGGVRRCLGAAFSDYESKIFLAAFLRRASVSLVHARPEPRVRRNITMGPKLGVPVTVQALRPR